MEKATEEVSRVARSIIGSDAMIEWSIREGEVRQLFSKYTPGSDQPGGQREVHEKDIDMGKNMAKRRGSDGHAVFTR